MKFLLCGEVVRECDFRAACVPYKADEVVLNAEDFEIMLRAVGTEGYREAIWENLEAIGAGLTIDG